MLVWVGWFGCVDAPAASGTIEKQEVVATPLADPVPGDFAVAGIDVSHHQKVIDWPVVAKDPRVKFAYLKATEGTTHQDSAFARNWTGARAAGLAVGAYHYFSFCSRAATQVTNFLTVLPKVDDMLPPVLDVEHLMNCPAQDPEKVRAELRVWLTGVEQATGRRPMLYATSDVLDEYIHGHLDYPLWVRRTAIDPEPVLHLPWVLWQHEDQYRIPGISTTVDQDVFRGTVADLEALRRRDP